MAFFRNDQVNWLNLHYGLNALARTGGDAFFMAFLLRQGFSAPIVLATMAAIFAGRFVVRPVVLPLAVRLGLRNLVIVGAVMVGAQYPLLAQITSLDATFAGLVLLCAVSDALYWTCYHAYFAQLGDTEHRGHQIAVREAISALSGVIGPLGIGIALNVFGPHVAFWANGLILAASALPLLATPPGPVARHAPGALAASLAGARWFLVDGWTGASFWLVWQMALFITLREQYASLGGAVALAALVGAASGLALGRWIDLGHGRKAAWLGVGAMALVGLARAGSFGNPALAVAATAAGAVAGTLYIPAMMTAVYNEAKRSPCPLRFHLAAEGGYDLGGGGGCLAAAGLLAIGWPMGRVLLLPLISLAAMGLMLSRHYGAAGAPLKPAATI